MPPINLPPFFYVALLCKLIRSFGKYSFEQLKVQGCCPQFVSGEFQNFTCFVDVNGEQFTDELKENCINNVKYCREQLDDLEGAFLAIAATLSIAKLIYWLQLSPKIGPVVINIRRIIIGKYWCRSRCSPPNAPRKIVEIG